MLKKRLIPKLLIKYKFLGNKKRPVLVTTRGFRDEIFVGDPLSQAKIYEAQFADELIILNIDSHPIATDDLMLRLVQRIADEVFMPLTIGGGVRTVEDFQRLVEGGADKVCINTIMFENPQLISKAAHRYGSQCVVASIDFKTDMLGNAYVVRDRGKICTNLNLIDFVQRVVELGAGEILLTDVDRDGYGNGLNFDICRVIASSLTVPVILSGGCGLAQHFVEGFQRGLAEGVASGTFFCFRDQNPMQTRSHIYNAGIAIRLET
ncbi:imidazole glycerol phosphate synthase subunit HisF [Anabaena aphanizomenioides LEGE 00250]|uniref:imidazole glycerol-phosphate synthase n=1 Tax=Sphaerospermopsis aphanizomenoides LEGE 00250 TaxID=2777972 RepID=A0ABR9VIW5_9CYAN|nr:imidazole glycerol phosphate synthase cyclase subunit [Sphaerospermopsis aphanizomenoides]MBE9237330.1 imidazole glycerol phosphate synthase subunit HisF [Sphaerospermopsis aphanizomenoides LEGE 00250]